MEISIRKFNEHDILNKILWVNDKNNNEFLHYDLPLTYGNTLEWFNRIRTQNDRYDAIIEVNQEAVGIIGLLDINKIHQKAEYYILLGDRNYRGKGVAQKASNIILDYGFSRLHLNRIYLFTEKNNLVAQKLFEKIGFKKEGLLRNDIIHNRKTVDRYIYSFLASEFYSGKNK